MRGIGSQTLRPELGLGLANAASTCITRIEQASTQVAAASSPLGRLLPPYLEMSEKESAYRGR